VEVNQTSRVKGKATCMKTYLKEEQLKSNLSLGFPIEQWLSHYKEEDYTVIRWLRIDKEKDQNYTLAYFECFDEGNENALDIYEFSMLNPDEPFGVLTQFDKIEDALNFSENSYGA